MMTEKESFIQLKKDNNLIFSVSKTNYDEEDIPYELIQFIKYASENKDFRFTCTEIVSNAKILTSPKRFGRLLNNNIELLKNEGVIITKDRQSDNRYYYCHYEEPTEEETPVEEVLSQASSTKESSRLLEARDNKWRDKVKDGLMTAFNDAQITINNKKEKEKPAILCKRALNALQQIDIETISSATDKSDIIEYIEMITKICTNVSTKIQ